MKSSTPDSRKIARFMRVGFAGLACLVGGAALSSACLNRPIGEQSPSSSNIFVEQIRNEVVDKIDLLFMIDNSISMADKQATLQNAVPQLVDRLITPNCVDPSQNIVGRTNAEGECAEGTPEFRPVRDMHIGVITSSIGGHGGSECGDVPPHNDRAWLMGKLERGAATDTGDLGFLNWAPGTAGGESDAAALTDRFRQMVTSVKEEGCGFEGSLEAWYRFLIDPNPPQRVVGGHDDEPDPTPLVLEGTDEEVLKQRAQFLRPDSLVAIIMLSDENDCSVKDVNGGPGWQVASWRGAPRPTSECDENPNDRCCRSCGDPTPEGCRDKSQDPACSPGDYYSDDNPDNESDAHDPLDNINLRCFNQKQRFGIDMLWETQRYVDGLTKGQVPDRDGTLVPNPLFAGGRPQRLVFLAGIVGVPWQDIADEASLDDASLLRYMTYQQLTDEERWDTILGDPSASPPVPPEDPLMRESVDPRQGSNPIINAALAPADSTNPRQNPINGHEADYSKNRRDLQYACIYRLPDTKTCTGAIGQGGCDCDPSELEYNRPLCNPPAGGPAGQIQHYAKAYPGLRHLEVLKGFGQLTTNAVVGSICPKILETPDNPTLNRADPSYGYNPAINALVDRLRDALAGKCLSRQLRIEENGDIPCRIVEVTQVAEGQSCNADGSPPEGCGGSGRSVVSERLVDPVRQQLQDVALQCGDQEGQIPCERFCMCNIDQLREDDGNALQRCQESPDDNELTGLAQAGYCYVDPEPFPIGQGIGKPEAVAQCDETSPRRLRFTGANTPKNNSITFIACIGETVVDPRLSGGRADAGTSGGDGGS